MDGLLCGDMQNGINILGYNFGKCHLAIKEIETTISKVVGRPISLKDINCISRIDINRDNRCKSEVEKQQLLNFFKKIKGHSGMEQNVYETGVTIGNGDVELKFYFKDEDINLGEEICSYMPKMCRTEFEIKNYRINKYYPEDLNLYTLLTNKKMTESVWNSLLDESILAEIFMMNAYSERKQRKCLIIPKEFGTVSCVN